MTLRCLGLGTFSCRRRERDTSSRPLGSHAAAIFDALRSVLYCFALAALTSSCANPNDPGLIAEATRAFAPRSTPVNDAETFPLPTQIVVSVDPYASAAEALRDEDNIDWQRDERRARAITSAFAAEELQNHLARIGIVAPIVAPSTDASRPSFVLDVVDPAASVGPRALAAIADTSAAGAYAIVPLDRSVHVVARDRVGVLHGVYRLLDELGFAWYDPYETLAPKAAAIAGDFTWRPLRESPRVSLRGHWIEGDEPVPDEYAIWLARNRLNVGGRARHALQQKLGLKGWAGGHALLREEFSRPGLFEQHPEWYAMIDGTRRPVQRNGRYFNPAFVNGDAARYFADRIIERLEHGDLRGVDVLNVWPSDDPFPTFDESPAALALGNETDNLLQFYANVAQRFREANADGRLSRRVTVAGLSYSATMSPPTSYSVTIQLEQADYLHIFSLLERTWSGPLDFAAPSGDVNTMLVRQMTQWQARARLDYGIVEHHNASAYAAVGVSDFPHAGRTHHALTDGRSGLLASMHPLLRNPGPRRLTNRLLSKLSWHDIHARGDVSEREEEAGAIIRQYFDDRYGDHASEWREYYEWMSASVENAKEMFGARSLYWLLSQDVSSSEPPYSAKQVVELIPRYRVGGSQQLPGATVAVDAPHETFIGLDESIGLQERAAALWRTVRADSLRADVRRRMESDVAWGTATASRYRLMAATCDFVLARYHGTDLSEPRARMEREIAFLESSPVTRDTISPVDQLDFLVLHRRLLED